MSETKGINIPMFDYVTTIPFAFQEDENSVSSTCALAELDHDEGEDVQAELQGDNYNIGIEERSRRAKCGKEVRGDFAAAARATPSNNETKPNTFEDGTAPAGVAAGGGGFFSDISASWQQEPPIMTSTQRGYREYRRKIEIIDATAPGVVAAGGGGFSENPPASSSPQDDHQQEEASLNRASRTQGRYRERRRRVEIFELMRSYGDASDCHSQTSLHHQQEEVGAHHVVGPPRDFLVDGAGRNDRSSSSSSEEEDKRDDDLDDDIEQFRAGSQQHSRERSSNPPETTLRRREEAVVDNSTSSSSDNNSVQILDASVVAVALGHEGGNHRLSRKNKRPWMLPLGVVAVAVLLVIIFVVVLVTLVDCFSSMDEP